MDSLTTSFTALTVPTQSPDKKSRKAEVADSWEDEAEEYSDHEEQVATPVRPNTSGLPQAPPPTPASRSSQRSFPLEYHPPFGPDGTLDSPVYDSSVGKPSAGSNDRRPDKTTAVASRLIAAAIGQRPPQRTKEQREYDQAMRLQEKEKRDKAREEGKRKQREKEEAQRSVWDD